MRPEDLLFPWVRSSGNSLLFEMGHLQTPIASIVAADSSVLFIDVKHDKLHDLHMVNFVVYSESLQETIRVASTRTTALTERAYTECFVLFFEAIDLDAKPLNEYIDGLETIMMDFSEAQQNGLKAVIIRLVGVGGGEIFDRLFRGCHIHYMRSVHRVAKLVTRSEQEQHVFHTVCNNITALETQEAVQTFFDLLLNMYPGAEPWVS